MLIVQNVALPYDPANLPAQVVYHSPRFHRLGDNMPARLQTLVAATLLCLSLGAAAADLEAGRLAAQAKCAQCHAATDWEGEDAASLESLIRDIAGGKVKHKGRIDLSSAEMTNVAAYWGSGGGKPKRTK